jgi:alpha-tubulin suppressor-like RCC1 family protein
MSGRSAPSPPREPPGQDIDPWIPAPPREERLGWRGKGFGIIAAGLDALIKINKEDSSASIIRFSDNRVLTTSPPGVVCVCVAAECEGLMYYAVLNNGDLAVFNIDEEGIKGSKIIAGANAVGVACASRRSVILTARGTIMNVRKGNPSRGIENVSFEPAHPEFTPRIEAVAIGDSHNVYLLEDGKIATVGLNNYHQLGTIDDPYLVRNVPVILPWLDSFVAIDVHSKMSGAVSTDGTVVIWGAYTRGSLRFKTEGRHAPGIAMGAEVMVILNSNGTLSFVDFSPGAQLSIRHIEEFNGVIAVVCECGNPGPNIIALDDDEGITFLSRRHLDVPGELNYPWRTRIEY